MLRSLVFLVIAYVPSFTAVFVDTGDWYRELIKPSWTPPNWLFGPVWIVLYCMIGIAGSIAWSESRPQERFIPFTLFGLQLVANALWTLLFFWAHDIAGAFFDIMILAILIILLIQNFYPLSKKAAYLLVPYLLWVLFATVLNSALYVLNR